MAEATRGRAATQRPTEDDKGDDTAATPTAPGTWGQSPEDAAKERANVMPKQAHGAGSGSRLLTAPKTGDEGRVEAGEDDPTGGQSEVSVGSIVKADDSRATVIVGDDVYEEVQAPGSTRKVQRLLFHKGQAVPKALIDRHEAAQRKAKKAADDDGDAG